ncbi:MAG: hypothetical protein HY699_09565 [Deltaproteobacteria bacterium]|nr:hypothetical protein [Deltaproteobacteria bacterium]
MLAAIAYAGSAVVGTAIASRLIPAPAVHISDAPPPLAREGRKPNSYYALISTRDIFNSTKPAPEVPKGPPPITELKVRLWGVAIHAGGNSSCVIEDLNTHQQKLYKVGDTIQDATVSSVEWERVILTRDGREEILQITPDARKHASLVASAVGHGGPAAPAPGAGAGSRPGDDRIQLVGENQYAIDRSEVDSALENMSQLFTQVRAVPHFEGGRSTGFRLFAIRQDSLFDKIGLKNGDILQRINGIEINDPGRAMGLFQELRNEREVTVDLVRNKEPKTLSYQFR